MTDEENVQAPIKLEGYGRLRVSGVQLLLLFRILEDSLRLTDNRNFIFSYTDEFRKQLYNEIMAQQGQEVR